MLETVHSKVPRISVVQPAWANVTKRPGVTLSTSRVGKIMTSQNGQMRLLVVSENLVAFYQPLYMGSNPTTELLNFLLFLVRPNNLRFWMF